MEIEDKKLYEKALKYKGESSQLDILIEELSEAIHATVKYKRLKEGLYEKEVLKEHLIEELGDVQIMINQTLINFNAENEFELVMSRKIERLKKRLKSLEEK